jgi:hypothetical protein
MLQFTVWTPGKFIQCSLSRRPKRFFKRIENREEEEEELFFKYRGVCPSDVFEGDDDASFLEDRHDNTGHQITTTPTNHDRRGSTRGDRWPGGRRTNSLSLPVAS